MLCNMGNALYAVILLESLEYSYVNEVVGSKTPPDV